MSQSTVRLYCAAPGSDFDSTHWALLKDRFANVGADSMVRPPFFCDYGCNSTLGAGLFLSYGCILDVAVRRGRRR